MPELPDVEGYRRALSQRLPGRRIVGVEVCDAGILRNRTADRFAQELVGRRFGEPSRQGKWLILPTDGSSFVVHNGMTGRPYFVVADEEGGETGDRYDRLVITTDDGRLRYADLRKLRGVWLADDDGELADVIGPQGPDALGLTPAQFADRLSGRRGQLKTVLMDQAVVAGLGNMLSDEICWRVRLHPATPVASVPSDELRRVGTQLRSTLRSAVRAGHIPRTRGWLNSRRADPDPAPCPRCATTLRRSRIGGRTSLWCPRCQPEFE
jgi:formamidopyrimidine-DNA glycosylase